MNWNLMDKLNVVGKIIAGFFLFGCLIITTNIISYIGLAEISDSAQTVIKQKMPVQEQMLKIQTGILTLAKISTNGFYEDQLSGLNTNKEEFDQHSTEFLSNLDTMEGIISSSNQMFVEGQGKAREYIDYSLQMYQKRTQQLSLNDTIASSSSSLLALADEASALMLDLSFIEGDDPNLEPLIGTGLNIDNKISAFIKSVKEYVAVVNPELSETIKGDIEFALSNIQVDADYLNRLAEAVETDGYVESFNEQFEKIKQAFSESGGLVSKVEQKIALITEAKQLNQQAEVSLNLAIEQFSAVFTQVNDDTREGQIEIIDTVDSNILKGLVILVFAIVVAVILGFVAARSIAKPVARINRSLSIISSGDLTHKAYSTNDDEFAVLAENVNQLTASLHAVVSQIHEQEAALDSATKTSASLGEQTLQQVEMQKEQVSSVAADTDTIRSASKNNTQQIQSGMSQLAEVSIQSESVSQLVAKTAKQISDQSRQATESSNIIHRLAENSKRIGSILDVIKTIAEQTNLLALNAAIEAARAGEQGRGFAVVADEVRTLANRTHNSTEEIESMIATLQRDAEQAVNAIAVGSEYAVQSETQIQEVNQQVEEIGKTIRSLRKMNEQIVSVTLQQDSLFENVADKLVSIVELAEKSAITTKESTQATGKLGQLMVEMKRAVSRFTL